MKKSFKRILAFVLVVSFMFAGVQSASAADASTYDGAGSEYIDFEGTYFVDIEEFCPGDIPNVLDNAVQKALDQQTTIGSVQSRLSYTSSNLTTASENVQASESTIRDADMAKEMTEYTKNNVLLQAAQSMLAQANQSSSSVLSLLQ